VKIQTNSDNAIAADASLTHSVKDEVSRLLGRFAIRLLHHYAAERPQVHYIARPTASSANECANWV
jgi:hypothetical protein